MPVKQKSVKFQNLNAVDTFIQENGTVSEYFNVSDFPEEVPTGRSSFLLLGSQYLRDNVSIKIEILDNQGNPIYIEPVYLYEEGNGVRVSIEIYQDVSEGAASLTMLGEIDPDKVEIDIPDEFIGVYNVKYTRPFIINKDIPNTRPIRFYKRPKVSVKEVFRAKLTVSEETSGSLTQTAGTVKGIPVSNTEGRSFTVDDATYGEVLNYTDQNYGASPIGNLTSEIGEKYTFQISNAIFSSSMQGGTITINSANAAPSFPTESYHAVTPYSASIVEVLNKNIISVQKPFGLFNSSSGQFEISSTDNSSYSIDYPAFRTFTTSSIDFKSFAELTVHTMRTFSGDVHRLAVYSKNNGPYGNWIKIADTPIESPELLINPNSTTGTDRLGFFRADSVVTSYYDVTGGTGGVGSTISIQTASDPEYMANSLYVSGSGVDMLADSDTTWIKVQLKPQYSSSFISGNEYIVSGKLIADNSLGSQETIKAVFHMSGSAFNMSNNFPQYNYGKPLGKVEYENSIGQILGANDPKFSATFTPDRSGTGVLQIRFTGGHWHVADLSIRPASETNFSPEIVKLVAPIPPLAERPDNLDFAVEFYDVNNNKAQTVITTMNETPAGVEFQGENLVIAGNDNTIAGSLFIGGDTTGSGIQMGGVTSTLPETGGSGASSSGFIRSVQYRGFTSASADNAHSGWMIYSGSVLPDSGDSYAGVGLELVGESGSFRFSTKPSRFEVVADAFYVGSSNTQFISGSGGIIEISSSAFHLSSSGDVTISGSITATEGYIGNWNIVDGKLSGSNATLDAVGAALYKSDAGPDSNPTNGYYIDFTPGGYYIRFGSDFAVSSSGVLIASGAKIEGVLTSSQGLIADWNINPGSLSATTSGKFTGISSVGDSRFFAGATSLAASSSAPFNVKATGEMTASDYLFNGTGVITGSVTIGNSATILGDLSANSIATPAAGPFLSQINSQGYARFVSASIGSFHVDDNALRGTGFYMSGSATGNQFFISSSNFNVKASGDITASAANIIGDITANKIIANTAGTIAGFNIDSAAISSSNSNLILRSTGEITASAALIQGASKIAGFSVTSTQINDASSNLVLKSSGQITASAAKITGDIVANTITANTAGTIANFEIDTAEIKSSNSKLRLKQTGQITASAALISGSAVEIAAPSLILDTDKFDIDSTVGTLQLGTNPTLTSGNGIFFSSSGEFRLGDSDGNINFINNSFTITGSDLSVNVTTLNIDATGFELSSTQASMSLGTSNQINLDADSGTGGAPIFKLDGGEISASKFQVSTVGEITASGGSIAGWEISDEYISKPLANHGTPATSRIYLSVTSSNAQNIQQGLHIYRDDDDTSAGDVKIIRIGELSNTSTLHSADDYGIQVIKNKTANTYENILYIGKTTQQLSGFNLSAAAISSTDGSLILSGSGQITGSTVLFTGGKIAGFTVASTGITSTGIGVHPTGQTYAFTAGGSNEFNVKHSGQITGSLVLFTGGTIGGFELSATEIKSSNNNLRLKSSGQITASNAKITGDIVANTITANTAGTIANFTVDSAEIKSSNSNLRLKSSGQITASAAQITGKITATSGEVGGWDIGSNFISGSNLILRNTGDMETANFASGLSGWRISAIDNGTAEFQNITIRGTLSTAVFEKESVNAVGGQLYVANSTVLTGSAIATNGLHTAAQTTMSVVNVTGFVENEILSLKKVHSTGFATEYVKVISASRTDSSSETDFSGYLYVSRALGSGVSGDSGSLGDTPGAAQSYSGSQVIVSTGKLGTGFMRLNANPNDTTTPYMDIVERTGSGIYDVDLKTRLGDLSGLSQTMLHGTNPNAAGFGLYAENVFLQGKIVATSGSIGNIQMGDNKLFTGAGTHGNSNTGFYLDSGSKFSLGDKLSWDGSNLSIEGSITITGGSGFATQGDVNTAATNSVLSASAHASTSSSAAQTAAVNTSRSELNASGSSLQTNINTNATNLTSVSSSFETSVSASQATGNQASSSAGSAIANAATAQAAIDTMETQVVLDSNGMGLWNAAAAIKLVQFGTTTYLYDGTGHTTSNEKLKINTTGVQVFANHTSSYAYLYAGGVQIVSASVERAAFGSTTTIGNTTVEHIELTDTSLKLKDGGTTRITMDSSGITMGNHISINSSGNASFSGELTVGALGQVSDVASVSSSAAQTAAEATAATYASNTQISASNLAASHANASASAASASVASGVSAASQSSAANISTAQSTANTAESNAQTGISNAATAQSTANTANTNASNAQATANTATGSAADASSSAATAINNAATAQSAIDTMETQVVLNSGGMHLRNNSAVNIASYGTTTYFYDGVGHAVANQKMKLNAAGVHVYANHTSSYAYLYSGGVQIVSASVQRALFGSTTTIGNTSYEHVEITDTALKLKDGGTTRVTMDSTGITMGNHISINSSGNASFSGELTIGALGQVSDVASVSSSAAQAAAIASAASHASTSASAAQTAAESTAATYVSNTEISASNLAASHANASASAASASVASGVSAASQSSAANITTAQSTATTAESNAQTGISNAATAQSTANTANTNASNAQSTANTATGSANDASASAANAINNAATAQSAIDTMETQVVLNSGGMHLRNSSAVNIASYGTTTYFYDGVGHAEANQKMKLNAAGVHVYANHTSSYAYLYNGGLQIVSASVQRALFGSTVYIGNTSYEHVEITDSALKLKDGGTTRLTMDSSGIAMGSQFSVDSSGNASFSGTLSIGSLPSGTVSASTQLSGDFDSAGSAASAQAAAIASAASHASTSASAAQTAAESTAATYVSNTEISASNLAASHANASASAASASVASGVSAASQSSAANITTAQNAANSAQSTANTATGSANDASSSAASAINNAATAQSAIDTMETQVVLDSGGMELRNASNQKVAKYGTTTYFYDGTASENVKLQLQAAGVKAFGATAAGAHDANTYSYVYSEGMQVVSASTQVGLFGSNTVIGPVGAGLSNVRIYNGVLAFRNNATVKMQIDATGAISASGWMIDAQGGFTASNADLSGKVTATSGQIAKWSIMSQAMSSSAGAGLAFAVADPDTNPANEFNIDEDGALGIVFNAYRNPAGSVFTKNTSNMDLENTSDYPNIWVMGSATDNQNVLFRVGDSSNYLRSDQSGFAISSSKFHVATTGNVTMNDVTASNINASGKITATTGTIGGFVITGTAMGSSAGNFILSGSAGIMRLGGGLSGGANSIVILNAASTGTDSYRITVGSATEKTAPFRVSGSGKMFATDAEITGKITATSGEIGGFGISSATISSSNNNIILRDNGQLTGSALLFNNSISTGTSKFSVTGGGTPFAQFGNVVPIATGGSGRGLYMSGSTTVNIHNADVHNGWFLSEYEMYFGMPPQGSYEKTIYDTVGHQLGSQADEGSHAIITYSNDLFVGCIGTGSNSTYTTPLIKFRAHGASSYDGTIMFLKAGTEGNATKQWMNMNANGIVINENSEATHDVRMESDSNTHMFFLDSGANVIGLNKSDPAYTLDVTGDIRVSDDLFVNDFARIDALRVGTTTTDPGDGNLYVEGWLRVNGDLDVNGDIVGDDSTDITNINQIYCDNVIHDGDTDTAINFGADKIQLEAGGTTIAAMNATDFFVKTDFYVTADDLSDGSYTVTDAIRLHNNSSNNYFDFNGGHLYIRDNGNTAFFIEDTTKDVGIGSTSPTARLHVADSDPNQHVLKAVGAGSTNMPLVKFNHSEPDLDTNDIILDLDFDDDTSIESDNYFIYFQNQDGGVGSINNEITYNTFTGAHISQRPSGSDFSDWKTGMIVKSTGEILQPPNSLSGSISMAWPVVERTTSQKDKAVMGVFTTINSAPVEHPNYTTSSKDVGRMAGLDDNAPQINYNSIGEGKILVTDTNGNIETGDYICSSARTGHGEKQDDDLLHNYTVAKATQPYNFASASVDADLGYKSVLIACTYHCG